MAVLFLPLVALSATQSAQAQSNGICSRTQQVRDAIVKKVSVKTACDEITETDLAAITSLSMISDSSLTVLKDGDFNDLIKLTELDLSDNNLDSLTAGVFDKLTSLKELILYRNSLASLPESVFDKLASLTTLELSGNSLNNPNSG